ncbi:zinc dependent phospholipase C family protein [Desmospora profundinema]|uniref:Phospholipase C/D domain-containing protein n=1 Tax=Desmospora profundinema TaxID=1571184 RepID=A0ABU1IRB8_9BACL|nr:zinc dependent phospholipase C family protein [Desmospora profundinema]MDR6227337.1 hypothetical protein [Desmospora profundinema]
MPNIWSHILFGHQVWKKTGRPLPADQKPYQLGCQGPDPLLYHRFWPWQPDTVVVELGNAIHRRHCGPFLLDLITAAKVHPDFRDYVAGFLTHHILDRQTHPYIIYRSGEGKYKHQELEVMIDTLLAERMAGIQTWNTPVVPRIDVGKKMPDPWAVLLHQTAQSHFPGETKTLSPDHWQQAYQDMKRALRFFFDPWRIKWVFTLGKIAPFRYRPLPSGNPYLNENRREWLHPAVPEEKHQESFIDLWEAAVEEGAPLLQATFSYWEGEKPLSALERELGNDSYETGKDCDSGLVNRVFAPIV